MEIDEQYLRDDGKEVKTIRFRESMGLAIAISIISIICALAFSLGYASSTSEVMAVFGGALFFAVVVFLITLRDCCKFAVMVDKQVELYKKGISR